MKNKIISVILILGFLLLTGCSSTKYLNDVPVEVLESTNYETLSKFTDDGTLPIQLGVTDETIEENIAHYIPISKSNDQLLYVDMEKGWLALKNLESGKIWYSIPNDSQLDKITSGNTRLELRSDILIGFKNPTNSASTENILTAYSHKECVRNKTVKVTRIDNGVRIEYDFENQKIYIPVEYTLRDGYLQARLDIAGILQGKPYTDYKIKQGVSPEALNEIVQGILVNVTILPAFGAQNTAANGYLFVPDGSGALIGFDPIDTADNYYSEMVYGDEPAIKKRSVNTKTQRIRIPVFGTFEGDNALMSIITQGDAAASIRAIRSNKFCNYTGVSSTANVQLAAKTIIYENDYANRSTIMKISDLGTTIQNYVVRYYTLSGSDAHYVGMAHKYQQYLTDEKGMNKTVNKPTLVLNLYGSTDVKASFLGVPYEKQKNLTTFDQALGIMKALKLGGIDSISLKYIGWNNYGLLNDKMVKKASPLSNLGGNNDFQKLNQYMKDNNLPFYPQVDFVNFRSSGNDISAYSDCIKTTFGEVALQDEFMQSTFTPSRKIEPFRMLNPLNLLKISERFLDSYKNLNLNSIAFDTVGDTVYSNLDKKNGIYRSNTPLIYDELFKTYKNSDINYAVDGGNAYSVVNADHIFSTPVYSSSYNIFTNTVPFYQIVFHGIKNLSGISQINSTDSTTSFLKSVETGIELQFDGMYENSAILGNTRYSKLFSTTFNLWEKDAANKYKQYYPLLEKIYDQKIVMHKLLEEGVYKTTYSNGISVIVNYNDVPYQGIKARGFAQAE